MSLDKAQIIWVDGSLRYHIPDGVILNETDVDKMISDFVETFPAEFGELDPDEIRILRTRFKADASRNAEMRNATPIRYLNIYRKRQN
jgi:hypothetical protein